MNIFGKNGGIKVDFDYLRLISLDERDNGKLTSISSDTFDMAREYIAELCEEAKSGDNFMTKRGTELIEEIESVQSVLQSIIDLRVKKIINLAEDLSKTGRSDKEQIKRMTPAEKQMYDEILAAISRCRDALNAVIPAGTASPQTKTATTAPSASYAPSATNEPDTETLSGGSAAAAEQTPSVTGYADSAYSENADNSGAANPVNAAGGEIGAQTLPHGTAAADAGTGGVSGAAESPESAVYADPLDSEDADIWDDADFRDFAAQGTRGAQGPQSTQSTAETQTAATASSDAEKTAGNAVAAGNAATGADNTPIEYELLCVKRDIDSFMGIDNKIYTISAGDILTLPVDNARVLRDRNIALNIKVSK